MKEVHSPFQLTSDHIAKEAMERIAELPQDSMFYTRMSQIVSGAVFEGIHLGLNAVESFDAQGPAELLSAYNAGVEAGKKERQE